LFKILFNELAQLADLEKSDVLYVNYHFSYQTLSLRLIRLMKIITDEVEANQINTFCCGDALITKIQGINMIPLVATAALLIRKTLTKLTLLENQEPTLLD
jgi:hypothetical protein